jgi:hypothetical protein
MNQANQWGQGSLGQQISTAGYMGGTMLGRGLQGLGQAAGIIPEDPRIAEARKMMEIKKELMESNIDPSDIDTFYPEMINKLNAAGFIDQANQAMRQYTQAQTAQGNLDARNAEIEARKVKALQSQREEAMPGLAIYKRLGGMPDKYDPLVLEQFKKTITPDNPLGDAGILKDAPLAKPEKYDVSKETDDGRVVYVDKLGKEPPWYFNEQGVQTPLGSKKIRDRSTKVNASVGDITTLDKVARLREDFLSETKPLRDTLSSAAQAGELLTQARGGNQIAASALRQTMGKIFKADAQISKAEINAIVSSSGVPRSMLDFLVGKAIGRPSELSLNEMAQLIDAMNEIAFRRRQKAQSSWRKQAERRNVTGAEIDFITNMEEGEELPAKLSRTGQSTTPFTLTPADEDLIGRNLNRSPQGTR